MEKLIVFDSIDNSINIHNVYTLDKDIDEYLEDLGYDINHCIFTWGNDNIKINIE